MEWPELRQSLLATDDSCSLLTRFELEGYEYDNAAQARGKLFHETAAEMLRTLRRTGEEAMAPEEALTIMREVCAQRTTPDDEVVTLPMRERRMLRIAVIMLASRNTFNTERIIGVEERLYATIIYPHPVTGEMVERKITGQPDALIAEPPNGAVCLDWKLWLQPPPVYSGEQSDTPEGVSPGGYFQQRVYAFLIFRNYPSIERVALREFYVLANEARVATVEREQMEHIETDLATQAELLDRKLAGGSKSKLWRPAAGHHCRFCPRPNACPIERDYRGEGAITGPTIARKFADELIVANRVRDHHNGALKNWIGEYGPVAVKKGKKRMVVGYKRVKNGQRFGVWDANDDIVYPPKPDPDPEMDASLDEAAARRKAVA